jgi:glycosyltransferase involved in cell wall biosynthesis
MAGIESYAKWIGVPSSRFSLIHNGLNLSAISNVEAGAVEKFRDEFDLEPGTPTIAGVFRLSEEKRPLLFLKVIKSLHQTIPNLRVFVAGIGPLDRQFMAEISKLNLESVVTYLGRREDVPVLIQASSMLLLVSSNEGLPNVLMEAQYLERPVVCTRAGGSPEIVVDGQTGFIVEKDDFKGLVKRCREILTDQALAKKMGAAARRHIAENFAVEQMVQKTLDVYSIDPPQPPQLNGIPAKSRNDRDQAPMVGNL